MDRGGQKTQGGLRRCCPFGCHPSPTLPHLRDARPNGLGHILIATMSALSVPRLPNVLVLFNKTLECEAQELFAAIGHLVSWKGRQKDLANVQLESLEDVRLPKFAFASSLRAACIDGRCENKQGFEQRLGATSPGIHLHHAPETWNFASIKKSS